MTAPVTRCSASYGVRPEATVGTPGLPASPASPTSPCFARCRGTGRLLTPAPCGFSKAARVVVRTARVSTAIDLPPPTTTRNDWCHRKGQAHRRRRAWQGVPAARARKPQRAPQPQSDWRRARRAARGAPAGQSLPDNGPERGAWSAGGPSRRPSGVRGGVAAGPRRGASAAAGGISFSRSDV